MFLEISQIYVFRFINKRLKQRCFPLKFAKFLRTSILKNICEQLVLSLTCVLNEFNAFHICALLYFNVFLQQGISQYFYICLSFRVNISKFNIFIERQEVLIKLLCLLILQSVTFEICDFYGINSFRTDVPII